MFSIPISNGIVWMLFFLVAVIVITMAFVFNYHWKYYGINNKTALIAKSIYAVGTMILLSAAYLFATMY